MATKRAKVMDVASVEVEVESSDLNNRKKDSPEFNYSTIQTNGSNGTGGATTNGADESSGTFTGGSVQIK